MNQTAQAISYANAKDNHPPSDPSRARFLVAVQRILAQVA
jgi:hypothetical protein